MFATTPEDALEDGLRASVLKYCRKLGRFLQITGPEAPVKFPTKIERDEKVDINVVLYILHHFIVFSYS